MTDIKDKDRNNEYQDYRKIADLDNEIEADILAQCLDDAGIPYNIRSFVDTAYSNVFQLTRGWGQIDAPIKYQANILDILRELRLGLQIDYTDDNKDFENGE